MQACSNYFFAVIAAVVAYLIGSIPFGFIIGKMHGIDIRTVGSCNIGATNVTRTCGGVAGKICFFCDFFKGAAPTIVAYALWHCPIIAMIVGFCAVLGHVFPLYLKFKGGKGVATAAGVALALAPYPLLITLALWAAVFFLTRYVSLASISAAIGLPIIAWIFLLTKTPWPQTPNKAVCVFAIVIAVATIVRHKDNIKRLLNGTENRFSKK